MCDWEEAKPKRDTRGWRSHTEKGTARREERAFKDGAEWNRKGWLRADEGDRYLGPESRPFIFAFLPGTWEGTSQSVPRPLSLWLCSRIYYQSLYSSLRNPPIVFCNKGFPLPSCFSQTIVFSWPVGPLPHPFAHVNRILTGVRQTLEQLSYCVLKITIHSKLKNNVLT